MPIWSNLALFIEFTWVVRLKGRLWYWFIQTHKQLMWNSCWWREHIVKTWIKLIISFLQKGLVLFLWSSLLQTLFVSHEKEHCWSASDLLHLDATLFEPSSNAKQIIWCAYKYSRNITYVLLKQAFYIAHRFAKQYCFYWCLLDVSFPRMWKSFDNFVLIFNFLNPGCYGAPHKFILLCEKQSHCLKTLPLLRSICLHYIFFIKLEKKSID